MSIMKVNIMKKILSFIIVAVFVLSITGVAYAEEICPKPPRLSCAQGQVVGMFKDDNSCLITRCVEKTENTVYCWNDATCVNGATWMDANHCAVDSDCVCGGMDLNSGKCYVGNKEYYNVNVDKTKDCSDYCTGLEGRLVKCVKNWCTLMIATDTTADANLSPPRCVTAVSGSITNVSGSCCIEGICKTTSNSCAQGLMVNFFGCDDTCTPKFECLLNTTKNCIMEGYQTQDTNPDVSCCDGLVPITNPELVGRATCVKSSISDGEKETLVKSEVKGLENAMLRVSDNETKAQLEEVLAKIQDKRKEQFAKLENIEISKDEKTNKTIIKGEGKAKFLGFIPTNKNYEYEVDEQGNIQKHEKAFDFLFKKEDPIDQTT